MSEDPIRSDQKPKRKRFSVKNLPSELSPRQVRELFGVDPKTVTRWANQNKIESFRTPSGHRRFPRDQEAFAKVLQYRALLEESEEITGD